MAVARAAHAEVLHTTNTEVPDEVDNDEDALDPANEQRALMAPFETARYDRAVQQFMAAERKRTRR
jgi:hypothetical protein